MTSQLTAPARQSSTGRTLAVAILLDVVAVLAFAAIGRRSHGESDAVLGVLAVGWPFLAGAGIGWLLVRAWRAPLTPRVGTGVWLCTWAFGMALRGLSGGGLAPSFLLVAAISLAVLLLGWRGLAALVRRLRGPRVA